MNKFLQTIHNLYNKVLPIAQNSGVELDLDYSEPAELEIKVEADDPKLQAELEEELKNAITRTDSGRVKLKVSDGVITISDTGTILSRPLCESLSHGRVKVKSRVGFGTSISIDLTKSSKEENDGTSKTHKLAESIKEDKSTGIATTSNSNKTSKTTKTTKNH